MSTQSATARPMIETFHVAKRGRPRNAIPSHQVTIHLPIAYFKILHREAARAGVRPSAFLVLLLRMRRGHVAFARAADAQLYQAADFSDADLVDTRHWGWTLSQDHRALLDEDRLQLGVNSILTWVTQALNQWIGRPYGLRDLR